MSFGAIVEMPSLSGHCKTGHTGSPENPARVVLIDGDKRIVVESEGVFSSLSAAPEVEVVKDGFVNCTLFQV